VVTLIVLVTSFVILRAVGWLGVTALDDWYTPLRIALALMFFVASTAHWGRGRPDLIRMVPSRFRAPGFLVTLTGILEILGALGLLIPMTAPLSAMTLALLLVALFPANIRAAREHLSILGRAAPPLVIRAPIQLIFITALLAIGVRGC